MNILHTSDWHLGISQDQSPREQEHKLFLEWLLRTLVERDIDVMVHGGDTFHYMQPSARCLKQYYEFLAKCATQTNLRQIVVTGGNHDSASRLDAPRDILTALDVHVVGGMSADEETWDQCLCPVRDKAGDVEAVFVAVPYVHESRLGVMAAGLGPLELKRQMVKAFQTLYAKLADLAQRTYPGVPLVATGHLTCYPEGQASIEGDFHTPLHLVEALGSLPPTIFGTRYSYVALGHIHKMFEIPGPNAWYAGSPVPTDIIEARTPRYVMHVTLDSAAPESHAKVEPIEVPKYRSIFEVHGTPDEVIERVGKLSWEEPLQPYLYVDIDVDAPMSDGLIQVEKAMEAFERGARPRIVRYREHLLTNPEDPVLPEDMRHVPLDELTPTQVFEKMYKIKHSVAPTPHILAAFNSLLAEDTD